MHLSGVIAAQKLTCQQVVAASQQNSASADFSREGMDKVSSLSQPLIVIKRGYILEYFCLLVMSS